MLRLFQNSDSGDLNSTILPNQSLELVTIVIIINVVIGGFSGDDRLV